MKGALLIYYYYYFMFLLLSHRNSLITQQKLWFVAQMCDSKLFEVFIIWFYEIYSSYLTHFKEVQFASFVFGGFTTVAVINPLDRKLANHTYVYWPENKCHKLDGKIFYVFTYLSPVNNSFFLKNNTIFALHFMPHNFSAIHSWCSICKLRST